VNIFIVLLIAAVVFLIVRAVQQHQKKVDAAWRAAANELGLAHAPAGFLSRPSLRGEVQNCQVVVDVYRRQSGKHSESFTRYAVHYPAPLGLGLELEREHMFSGVAKFFGSQDIEVGDGGFDDAVMVKGTDAHAIRQFLTPSRRMRVLRLFDSYAGCKIDDGAIRWRRRGTETDARAITTTVRRLVRTARGLHGEPDTTDTRLDAALLARREGRLEDALTVARETASASETTRPEAKMLEGDVLYAAGRYPEAADAYAEAERIEPSDPDLAAWAEHVRRGKGEIVDAVEVADAAQAAETAAAAQASQPDARDAAAPAAETAPGATRGDDALTVCKDLFESEALSLQIGKRFERHYKNRRIRWTGVLRQARSYAFDLVFGQEPGTKLVVDLLEVKSGAFGRMVQAVVQLPKETLGDMQARLGQQITFEGRLTGCDAFMRNLFVAGGRVID